MQSLSCAWLVTALTFVTTTPLHAQGNGALILYSGKVASVCLVDGCLTIASAS